MTDALKLLDAAKASKITPVFITVDPERDTPAVIKSYVWSFSPRMVGLTGSLKQVQEAENGYKVYAAKASSPSGSDYTMNHSAYIYLMGPDGWRGWDDLSWVLASRSSRNGGVQAPHEALGSRGGA